MAKLITTADFAQLSDKARASERGRTNLNWHPTPEAAVQRLFLAFEPNTYIRPHRHPQPHKWELFVLLQGELEQLLFDDNGTVIQRQRLAADGVRAVEIPSNTWHSYICLQPGSIALEIKEGAYIPADSADFAPWSPAEGSAEVARFLHELCSGHR